MPIEGPRALSRGPLRMRFSRMSKVILPSSVAGGLHKCVAHMRIKWNEDVSISIVASSNVMCMCFCLCAWASSDAMERLLTCLRPCEYRTYDYSARSWFELGSETCQWKFSWCLVSVNIFKRLFSLSVVGVNRLRCYYSLSGCPTRSINDVL